MWYMNDERRMLQQAFREFAQTKVRPYVKKMEQGADAKVLLKEMGELGFLGLNVDEKYGGSGADYINATLLLEEISKESVALGLLTQLAMMFNGSVIRGGSEEQIQKFVVPAVKGEIILALGGTEPSGGNYPDGWETMAVEDGHDWVINGMKSMVTGCDIADYVMTMCKTREHVNMFDPVDSGLVNIMIPTKAEGFSVGRVEKKIGLNGSHMGPIYFDNIRLSDDYKLIKTSNSYEAQGLYGALSLGACEALLAKTREYLMTREQYGKTLWDGHESIRNEFGVILSRVNLFRISLYGHMQNVNEGEVNVADALSLKSDGNRMAIDVAEKCIALFGGIGVIESTDVSRYLRDAIALIHACGTDRVHYGNIAIMDRR